MTSLSPFPANSYLNPVFRQTFADPFVLKYRGQYWAYCTGLQADGGAFGVLRSYDLVSWLPVGSAMRPLPGEHPCYWAPEVTYDNGRFFLYYSVGNEETMHIRVALSKDPAGPFVDSGRRLTGEPFAIDPHVFLDDDGQRYLFYATDFYDHTHIGTGTVRDRLVDPFTLAGQPRPVSCPRYEWQVYDAQRAEKGGVRWHTIEGPFVLKRKGVYYQMFSGGNWQNPSYGVAYAVAEDMDARGEWQQVCDGERVPPILQTAPGKVKGPGHNSVVRGPDNVQQICVYHRWADGEGRQMAIDALDWAGERMLILGPSHTSQRAPLPAHFADFLAGEERDKPRAAWKHKGSEWIVQDGAAMPEAARDCAELRLALLEAAFVAEVSVAGSAEMAGGAWGVALYGENGLLLNARLAPEEVAAVIRWQTAGGQREQHFALPEAFDFSAYHLLRLEVDGLRARVALDDIVLTWQGEVAAEATALALRCEQTRAAFSGFALTRGWQELFTSASGLQERGWRGDVQAWRIEGQRLAYEGKGDSRLCRGPRFAAYEAVINACLERGDNSSACYGFLPALDNAGEGPLLTVARYGAGWRMTWRDGDEATDFALPTAFDGSVSQQFRFLKEGARLTVVWEGHEIGSGLAPATAAEIGLYGCAGAVSFDMVRVTAISGAYFETE